jgi:hypothetical protein
VAINSVNTSVVPTSLEEAFNMVQHRNFQTVESKPINPLDNFVLNLAGILKEHKEIQPIFQEEIIPKEIVSSEPKVDVLNNLTIALQRAKLEIREKENSIVVEEVIEQQDVETTEVESKPNPLVGVFSKLAEALQQKKSVQVPQVTDEEFEVALNEALDQETEKQYAAQFTQTKNSDPLSGVLSRLVETLQKIKSPVPQVIEEEKVEVTEIQEQSYIPTNIQENPYVKELNRVTQPGAPKSKTSKKRVDIKKLIADQIAEQLTLYKQHLFASHDIGGGGGTNAVQYAGGGTMNGDLNVTGRILSGGVDISEAIKTAINSIVIELPAPKLIDSGPY